MLEYLFYRISSLIVERIPVKVSYKVASAIADIWFLNSLKDRNAVINNLGIILHKDATDKAILPYAKGVFRNFAKYLVDFLRFSRIDQQWIRDNVRIRNIVYLEEALLHNKGVICLTAHIGNWELAGAVTAMEGFIVNAIALDHKDKRVNEFFIRQRKNKNVNIVPAKGGLDIALKVLRKNEVLGVLGDRDFSNYGVKMHIFNKETAIPKGPAILCLKTGAPIVMAFMIRQGDDSFELIFEKPLLYKKTGNKNNDVMHITNMFINRIENYIRQYPTQWYMFVPFWSNGN